MIGETFNKLDNDFITVWSKYLLFKEHHEIIDEIECLAEKGQINAVQAWYSFKQKGINEKIDQYIDSYTGKNFNECLAIALSLNTKENQEQISLLYQNLTKDKRNLDILRKKLLDLDFFKNFTKALKQTKEYEKANNYVVLERYPEMLLDFASVWPIERDKKIIAKKVKKEAQNIKKMLLKDASYYRFPSQISDKKPYLAFSLAKNLYFFGKKDKRTANVLLTKLAIRKYSQDLTDALKNHQHLKQKHNEKEYTTQLMGEDKRTRCEKYNDLIYSDENENN